VFGAFYRHNPIPLLTSPLKGEGSRGKPLLQSNVASR
jgi:hypothetical protein